MAGEARTALASSIQKWGKKFNSQTNAEMVDLITKIHELEGKDYSGVGVEKGIRYGGDDERQRLDIYYPKGATPESKLPVVIFFHGGGMVFGDTDVTPLFHSNIGTYPFSHNPPSSSPPSLATSLSPHLTPLPQGKFLATNSTILISATYRLLPKAAHPSGAIDASLAISWAITNSPRYGGCPATSLTVIGHSAGGSCIGTALWGGFLDKNPRPIVKGNEEEKSDEWEAIITNSTFIFLSAGLWYDVDNPPTSINMPKYHRTEDKERIRREMPVALLREVVERQKRESREGKYEGEKGWRGPKMRFFLGEWEFEEIVKGTEGCEGVWEEGFGGEDEDGAGGLDVEMVWGENHVSYVYGIGMEGSWISERLLEIVKGEQKKE
ncbi:Alpha/Beta hydrolase protein [Cadophora sp. MPI-SDFR-AT-0126]|nr:Alpha/Beta hydrolase protein [Leotiomycetes sp. MPI-SDFR-AT-0126]